MVGLLLRFRDLKDRRIVSNHVTLGRWIAKEGFPPGFMLGPNTWVWREDDIDAWIARPRGVRRVDVFVGLAREKEVPFMRGSVHLERVRQAPEILLELLETRDWPRSWITPSNPLNLNGSETDLSVSIHPRSYERETVREQIAQEWLSESDRLSHA